MSFVITLYTREGMVMAADSRLTLTTQQKTVEGATVSLAVPQSDSNYKLFQTPQGFGLSTFGAADIAGVPIAGYIESFMRERLAPQPVVVDAVPDLLLEYFSRFSPPPDTSFHIAGYQLTESGLEQHVWQVTLSGASPPSKTRLNEPGQQGATWGGEADILARLVQPLAMIDSEGKPGDQLPQYDIPWEFFTLQDAIDFSVFAVRSTIEAIRFQPRAKTVGGPIDVLVIKPTETVWVQRKELHGEASRPGG
jgi:hypothetical protein